MKNKYLLLVFLFFIALTCFSVSVPFFWDSVYFSSQANYFFFSQQAHPFLLPLDLDNGGFPLYAVLLSFSWKILGYSLFSAHLIMLPFLLGIAYEYFKLCKHFLSENLIPWALLLLCLEPCFITQSMLMAYDILITYFFLSALNAILSEQKTKLAFLLLILSLIGIRGMVAAAALGLIHLLLNASELKTGLKNLLYFLPALIVVIAWSIYHKQQTGWVFFSPQRALTDEHLLGIKAMGKQFILICWKLVDSGRIFLWLILGGGLWFYFQSKKSDYTFKILLQLLFIPLICFLCIMVPLSNPGSARYFIPVYLLLIIAVCYLLETLSKGKRILAVSLLALGLVSGNFWIYPERFSNGWDTSLKVLPFFQLEREMADFIRNEQIPAKEVGTQFPLIDKYQDRYITLEDHRDTYTNALAGPVRKFHYYLHSNACNTDLLPQIEVIKPKWKLLKEFCSGQVYISLYENPDWH
jgi:hypothetical protein